MYKQSQISGSRPSEFHHHLVLRAPRQSVYTQPQSLILDDASLRVENAEALLTFRGRNGRRLRVSGDVVRVRHSELLRGLGFLEYHALHGFEREHLVVTVGKCDAFHAHFHGTHVGSVPVTFRSAKEKRNVQSYIHPS